MPLCHLEGFFCSKALRFFVLFILTVIRGISVSTPFQSLYCVHAGFSLHLELLAEMSLFCEPMRKRPIGELSPSLPQSMLVFLWQFVLWTNFLVLWQYTRIAEVSITPAHTRRFLRVLVKSLKTTSHLPLTFAQLTCWPLGGTVGFEWEIMIF